jgi:energy-coupling factor transport system permease protein
LIRLVVLLVFVAGMTRAQPLILAAGLVALSMLHLLTGLPGVPVLLLLLKRLRWLLLAILIVYGWWTPGDYLVPALGGLSPTITGLEAGLLRLAALLLIAASVNLLLQLTGRDQLLPALIQLVTPFSPRGARERFAVRVILSLEAVMLVQPVVATTVQRTNLAFGNPAAIGHTARRIYQAVLDGAGQAEAGRIEIATLDLPPCRQWLLPVLLAGLIWVSA